MRVILAASLLALLLLAGCSGSDPTPAKTVRVRDNSFDPTTVNVAKGQTVAWTSEGQHDHTVAIVKGTTHLSNEELHPGGTVQYTFDEAGDFFVHCDIHSNMEMRVTVT